MRIGLIAPPWVPVPPPAYGGTEVVVDQLARGLREQGHDVRLFTIGESTCPVPTLWRYCRPMPIERSVVEAAHLLSAYEAMRGVDLIHDHTTLGPLLCRPTGPDAPVVTTIHSPFTPEARSIYAMTADAVPLVCISHAQRRSAPEVPVATVIHHGLDPDDFPPGPGDGGYLLFLGRMSPDKGVDRAIEVARRTGMHLLIAAKMREPAERAYFREAIRPLLGSGVEYVGEVRRAERLDLLQHATALLNPIRWPEPFGMVMIESLACGTPVVAAPMGAAPEIVDDGRTGHLCSTLEEFVEAVRTVGRLNRADCRAAVLERFSTTRMTQDHLALYGSVLGEPDVPAALPSLGARSSRSRRPSLALVRSGS